MSTFVYNSYIKERIPKYVRLSDSRRPQGDSADTQCPQAAQRKQAKRACSIVKLNGLFVCLCKFIKELVGARNVKFGTQVNNNESTREFKDLSEARLLSLIPN